MAISTPTFPLGAGVATIRLVIQTNSAKHKSYLAPIAGAPNVTFQRLDSFMSAALTGAINANINLASGGLYASGTVTNTGLIATNTVTINGIVLTGVASNPTNAQFLIGGSNTATSANLAAAINKNTSLNQSVYATAASTITTVYCLIPGVIGNLCTLAISANGSVSGATMTGGTDASAGNFGTSGHGL